MIIDEQPLHGEISRIVMAYVQDFKTCSKMQLLENPIQTTIAIGALHSTVLQDDQFADLIRNENLAIHFLDFI